MSTHLIEIERFLSLHYGTFGTLRSGAMCCFTVERPWLDNHVDISCIPAGIYDVRRGTFVKGGGYPDLELVEVPGRQNIEIHAANRPEEVKGCIAPNAMLKWQAGEIAGAESKHTLQALLDSFTGDTAVLIIREAFK